MPALAADEGSLLAGRALQRLERFGPQEIADHFHLAEGGRHQRGELLARPVIADDGPAHVQPKHRARGFAKSRALGRNRFALLCRGFPFAGLWTATAHARSVVPPFVLSLNCVEQQGLPALGDGRLRRPRLFAGLEGPARPREDLARRIFTFEVPY